MLRKRISCAPYSHLLKMLFSLVEDRVDSVSCLAQNFLTQNAFLGGDFVCLALIYLKCFFVLEDRVDSVFRLAQNFLTQDAFCVGWGFFICFKNSTVLL